MTFEKLTQEIERLQNVTFLFSTNMNKLKHVTEEVKLYLDLINNELSTGWHQGENYNALWDMKTDLCILKEEIYQLELKDYYLHKGIV